MTPIFESRLRVRYAETDQMGVVYYANYLVWFEVGRTDLLRESGGSYRELEKDGIGLPVIEDHEADAVSAPHQLLAQEDLLTLGSADMCNILAAGDSTRFLTVIRL